MADPTDLSALWESSLINPEASRISCLVPYGSYEEEFYVRGG